MITSRGMNAISEARGKGEVSEIVLVHCGNSRTVELMARRNR